MAYKKREKIKKTENNKSLNCVFMFLAVIVAIGFAVAITVLIHERIQFSQTLKSAVTYNKPMEHFENLARLLEAHNKSNTTEILSLLYTVLATIAFSYGLIVLNKINEDAQETEKDLAEIKDKENFIRNVIFFSRLENRLNMGLCIAVTQKTYLIGRYSVWLTTLAENLHDCEEHFPVWEIKRRGEIDTFSQRGLWDILSMIQNVLTSIQQEINVDDSTPTLGSAAANDQILIEDIRSVCKKYSDVLCSLKINDQFPE
jgi:hypothetical protein